MADDRSRRNSSAEGSRLSLDTVFDLLGNRRRRTLLLCLRERSAETFRLSDVVPRLVDAERSRSTDRDRRSVVETKLRHIDLPKLCEQGLVTDAGSEDAFCYHPDERLTRWLRHVESETAGDTAR